MIPSFKEEDLWGIEKYEVLHFVSHALSASAELLVPQYFVVSKYSLGNTHELVAAAEQSRTTLRKDVITGPYYVLPPIKTEPDECDQTSSRLANQYVMHMVYKPFSVSLKLMCNVYAFVIDNCLLLV